MIIFEENNKMISIFYTGDKRHNIDTGIRNHASVIEKLKELGPVTVHWFTKDSPDRGKCPYDFNEPDLAKKGTYRRGQGGAVQVWDFMESVDKVEGPIVIKFRPDVWFTEKSIDVFVNYVKKIINGELKVAFFGSDWVNDNAGAEEKAISIDVGNVQDFIIAANKEYLRDKQEVYDFIDSLSHQKRRSGNKLFRFIVDRAKHTEVLTIMCHLWLIRQYYKKTPTDKLVCWDYIQSYAIENETKKKLKGGGPHPMQDAYDWFSVYYGSAL
jgi:hypothetical protein